MSSSISHASIGGEDDGRMVLSNSAAARYLDTDGTFSSWNELWIATRLAIGDAGGSISSTPRFYIGLMASPDATLSNSPLTSNCSNFVGIVQGASPLSRFNTGAAVQYNGAVFAASKVGGTLSTSTFASGNGNCTFSGAPSTYRVPIVLRLVKGSPNYTVQCVTSGSGSVVGKDVSLDLLKTSLEESSISSVASVLNTQLSISGAYKDSGALTRSVDEATNGTLNAVVIAWDRTTVPVYFSEILLVKKS